MRLWHTELIQALPRKQLIAQWRELLAIKGKIDKCGSPQHGLVNFVLDYPIKQFKQYAILVTEELERRGYNADREKKEQIVAWEHPAFAKQHSWEQYSTVYGSKMCNNYFMQCYYNLEEKHDCGLITAEEWGAIHHVKDRKNY